MSPESLNVQIAVLVAFPFKWSPVFGSIKTGSCSFNQTKDKELVPTFPALSVADNKAS